MSAATFTAPSYVVQDSEGNVVAGMQFTIWTAKTGGTQVTALQDLDGDALPGYVTSDSKGRVWFADPAARDVLYAQPPGTPVPARWLLVSDQAQINVGTAITRSNEAYTIATAAQTTADAAALTATGADGRSQEALTKANEAIAASPIPLSQALSQLQTVAATIDDLAQSVTIPAWNQAGTIVPQITGSTGMTTWVAPIACRITAAWVWWEYFNKAVNDTDYYDVRLSRNVGLASNTTIASRDTKVNSGWGAPIVQRVPWDFAAATWDEDAAVLQPGESFGLVVSFQGSPGPMTLPLGMTWRYAPL